MQKKLNRVFESNIKAAEELMRLAEKGGNKTLYDHAAASIEMWKGKRQEIEEVGNLFLLGIE